MASLPLRWRFYSSGLYISPVAPLALGFLAGVLTVFLGIGGGFILVPAMIYLLGMPARIVIGTSLVMILTVSAGTTMVHSLTTRAVDIVLAGLLLIGGVIGAQYGALLTTRLKPDYLRLALALIILLVAPAHVPWPVLAARRDLLDRLSVKRRSPRLRSPARAAAHRRRQAGARARHLGAPGADPLQLHRRAAAAVRRGRLSRRAAAGPATDIAVVLRGPVQPILVREKQKIAGIWMNADSEPLPLGALLLRGRLLAADPPTGR